MNLIRFPLLFKAGKAEELPDVGNVYDPPSLITYFRDGRLERWLQSWDYHREADCISKIDKNQKDDSLCHELEVILGFTDQQINRAAEQGRKMKQEPLQKLVFLLMNRMTCLMEIKS